MKSFIHFQTEIFEEISQRGLDRLSPQSRKAAEAKMKADGLKSSTKKSSDPLAAAAPNVKRLPSATKSSAQRDPLKSAYNKSKQLSSGQSTSSSSSSNSRSTSGALATVPKTQMVKRNTGTSAKTVDDKTKKKPIHRDNRTYSANKPAEKERFSDKVDKKIGDMAKKAGSKIGDGLRKAPGAALKGAGKLGKAVIGAKSASLSTEKEQRMAKSATREYGDSQY